jgi:endonuclease/exonuclease/phosphatase family metal-dependent hydrolase
MKNTINDGPSHRQFLWRAIQAWTPGSHHGRLWALLAVMLAAAILPAQAKVAGVGGKRSLEVMTVNLYVGGDINRVMMIDPAATNYVEQLVGAVTGVYYEILASAPAVRLQTVAGQIAAKMPDIVAVEEASLLRVQSPGDLIIGGSAPATDVVVDYLQMLVAELEARGVHYKVVSTADEIDVELPMFNLQTGMIDDVRLSDREAILVRSDLPDGQLRASNPQSGNFVNVIPIPALGLSVTRGWCAADVFVRGRNIRCICAHLETEVVPELQAAQVLELLAGPADTKMPVIVFGDFNADPLHRDGSIAYDLMPAAGFGDVWSALNPNDPAGGLTWGHDEYLADPDTAFDRRIDFIFYRGKGIVPAGIEVLDMATGLTQPPLWATDHAAVSSSLLLK